MSRSVCVETTPTAVGAARSRIFQLGPAVSGCVPVDDCSTLLADSCQRPSAHACWHALLGTHAWRCFGPPARPPWQLLLRSVRQRTHPLWPPMAGMPTPAMSRKSLCTATGGANPSFRNLRAGRWQQGWWRVGRGTAGAQRASVGSRGWPWPHLWVRLWVPACTMQATSQRCEPGPRMPRRCRAQQLLPREAGGTRVSPKSPSSPLVAWRVGNHAWHFDELWGLHRAAIRVP
jgi:hypothetical protein